jgi:hypothetical protein
LTNFSKRLISLSFRTEKIAKEADLMYAVVTSGGKQYKVEEGETLKVEKIAGDVGSSVRFDRVLMIADGDTRSACSG